MSELEREIITLYRCLSVEQKRAFSEVVDALSAQNRSEAAAIASAEGSAAHD